MLLKYIHQNKEDIFPLVDHRKRGIISEKGGKIDDI